MTPGALVSIDDPAGEYLSGTVVGREPVLVHDTPCIRVRIDGHGTVVALPIGWLAELPSEQFRVLGWEPRVIQGGLATVDGERV